MKKIAISGVAFIMMLLSSGYIKAQDKSGATTDYDKFRKEMLQGYESFREGVYDDYDKFLEGMWRDYDTAKGYKPDATPKPKDPPTVKPQDPIPEPVVVIPQLPDTEPDVPEIPTPPPAPLPVPNVVPAPVPITPIDVNSNKFTMNFYGAKLKLRVCTSPPRLVSSNKEDIAEFWRALKKSDIAKNVDFIAIAETTYGLNDWCLFQVVKNYSEQVYRNSEAEQLLTQHLLMTGLGFDVRIAVSNGEVCLLLPFHQQVYNNMYLTLDKVNYYLYPATRNYSQLSTCDLPKDCDAGSVVDLNFSSSISLPQNDKMFNINGGGLTLQGNVNKNLIELLGTFPLMEIPQYARSRVDMKLRNNIVDQLKTQVDGMSQLQAANAILALVQHGFKYMYDIDQFGQTERPLFFEETLFYPACDCEDRSIFFSYLMKEVLNLDVDLINYPGHEATAVAFTEAVTGTYYVENGKRFVICDPTYVGAQIGMCMPDYREVSPTVEKWY